MSDMHRLKELAALFKPVVAKVNESADPLADLDGITTTVKESIEDIQLKLGKNSALSDLIEKCSDPVIKVELYRVAAKLDQSILKFSKEINIHMANADRLFTEHELNLTMGHKAK